MNDPKGQRSTDVERIKKHIYGIMLKAAERRDAEPRRRLGPDLRLVKKP